MYTPNERKALFDLFKSGSIENVALAIQLSKNAEVDLYLPHFEKLFNYLAQIKALNYTLDIPIANKVHHVLTSEAIELKITDSDFAVIPASIYLLKNLKKLSIAAQVEVHIPNTITYFEHLEELEIYLLNQEKFPASIFEIESLVKLDLSLNLFEELPREVWKLRNLTELNLLNCVNLHTIPNELFGLPKLKTVLLLQTLVDEISPSIAYSPIEKYVVELGSAEGKKIMANPKFGRKILTNISKETKWSIAFTQAISARVFSKKKVENIPNKIKEQGLEAIKDYFKGKTTT